LRTFLLSSLSRAHEGATLDDFVRERPGPWLVWEAGPWRPPSRKRETLAGGAGIRLLSSSESLAIQLAPRTPGAEVRLGRDPACDLVVDDATLSRVHLVFVRDASGGWTVRDAGSRNGTRVDGAAVGAEPAALAPYSRIEAGAARLTFYDAGGLFRRLRGP
jgi:hypothetical protein